MEIEKVHKKGRTGQNYLCLLAYFSDDPGSKHFEHNFRRKEKGETHYYDWMPRDSEMAELLEEYLKVNPDFEDRVRNLIDGSPVGR